MKLIQYSLVVRGKSNDNRRLFFCIARAMSLKDVPLSDTSFSALDLKPELLSNLDTIGFTKMTPIQAQSLPAILKGQDVIGQGKTGSGKTALLV